MTQHNLHTEELHPEVAKFAAQAGEWWDPEGPFKPLHAYNKIRTHYVLDQVSGFKGASKTSDKPLNKLKILDVGCGGGLLCESLASNGATVTGIDLAEASLDVARAHATEDSLTIDYRCQSVEELVASKERFDVVTCMEVLEHVDNMPEFLGSLCKLLKKGSTNNPSLLFLSTLNRTHKSLMFAKVATEYVLGLLPAGTHDFRKFIKPSEIREALPQNVSLVDLQGVHYQPFTQEMALCDDVSINYMACLKRVS